jgi:nucleoside-diphosphate-sugar epimerase
MTQRIVVTGATGLVGSNACRLALEQGERVRAFVRSAPEATALTKLGAEVVEGDIADEASVRAALAGADLVVHAAAQIGGTWTKATPEDFERVNQQGSLNVLRAAELEGVGRTVLVLSAALYTQESTLTETSPVRSIRPGDSPYIRTKRAAYYEGMARAARGQDVVFVVPGGIFGPSVFVERALVPTIFNSNIVNAARGRFTEFLPIPISWVLGSDVAEVCLAALDRGLSGHTYLAVGGPDAVHTLAGFCNAALAEAGIDRRVVEVDPTAPGVAEQFGSMALLLSPRYPEPLADASATTAALGVVPTPFTEAIATTVRWLRQHGLLP